MTLSKEAFREIDRKARASDLPVKYYKRAVEDRILDFDEVILGYDEERAMAEAARCLQCPDPQPCTLNCPAGNDLPAALWHISQDVNDARRQLNCQPSPISYGHWSGLWPLVDFLMNLGTDFPVESSKLVNLY